jgi:hypothetical protein
MEERSQHRNATAFQEKIFLGATVFSIANVSLDTFAQSFTIEAMAPIPRRDGRCVAIYSKDHHDELVPDRTSWQSFYTLIQYKSAVN